MSALEKKLSLPSIEDPFETSAMTRARVEAARQGILAETYLINLCRILTIDGVQSINFKKINKNPSYGYMFHIPKNLVLKDYSSASSKNVQPNSFSPAICDGLDHLRENAKKQYEVEVVFESSIASSGKQKILKQSDKFVKAARGSLVGAYSDFTKSVRELPDTVNITKENYQNFICDALDDPKRKIILEKEAIAVVLKEQNEIQPTRLKNKSKTL